MEEKKRKTRPTFGQVRQLEAEIAQLRSMSSESLKKQLDEQIGGTSRLVRDCDDWREKFQRVKAEKESLCLLSTRLQEENNELSVQLNNKDIEIAEKCAEIARLRSRGFFGRLFNL